VRILIAEDNPRLGPAVKRGLEASRYSVDLAANGTDALAAALDVPYDLIILDVLLPEVNGFEVCRRLRAAGRQTPVIMLTALGEVDHRVRGLDLGADDYLVKPFAFRELEARVRALLRREGPATSSELRFLDIQMDTHTHEVKRGSRPLALTAKEFALLEMFLRHPRQALTRTMIADHVWDEDGERFSNVIDVYVRYLRRKLCEQGEPDVIHTVRGLGYQLKEP
jgi:DNA-binding response OmpR family regulator